MANTKTINCDQLQTSLTKTKNYIDNNFSHSDHFHNFPTSLPADGGNADTIDYYHIWSGTQEELDALPSRDSNTIYLVKNYIVFYSISTTLNKCTSSNSIASIKEKEPYITTITADDGYSLSSVTVTMGGIDITSSVVNEGVVNISSVTGDIVITATAIEAVVGFAITNINVLSSTVADTRINYTTNKPVVNHYFIMFYDGTDSGWTDAKYRVTNNGNNNYTMTFNNALSAGMKNPAIKVEDADGNVAIRQYELTITA